MHPSSVADLPAGTVTLFFTDVEGSTRLLAELGDDYAGVLAEHRRVLRAAFAAHGGVEIDAQGDAFFGAFRIASNAIAAAGQASQALVGGPLRVRVGIHTGTPMRTEEGYVGIDVHRAARICAAGHGGQVVLSDQTRRLLEPTVELTDLGLHRLKDLPEPERLYQVGTGVFPPLRTLNATNLPAQTSSLVGRIHEVAELRALVPTHRVTTLSGAGGSGKTRLALEVAAELVGEFPDGVFWVPLAAISSGELVEAEIAKTLGARTGLAEHIAERHMLLLLDNFEQLLERAATLAALTAACPRLHLLVTSRAPLRIAGEYEFVVDPLLSSDAVTLFRERAPAAEPIEAVAAICRRLDDLPLAIELAAARTRLLPPKQLLERLDERLPLLTSGRRDAPERQRTLEATIAWSHDLLSPEEQRVFRQLAVFSGGFTVESAAEVCAAEIDTLGSLVEQSLVRRLADGRLGMLETIREFALARLAASGEFDAMRRRHAEWCLATTRFANVTAEASGEHRPDLVLAEQDNIREALTWALEAGETGLGLELALGLELVWQVNSPFELTRWLEAFEAQAGELPLADQARILRVRGAAALMSGDLAAEQRLFQESLETFRMLDDQRGIGDLLSRLAESARRRGDLPRARIRAEESLQIARRLGDPIREAPALGTLGQIEFDEGRHALGLELLEKSAALAGETGFGWWQGVTLGNLAERTAELGRHTEAAGWSRASLKLLHRFGDRQNTLALLAELARVNAVLAHDEEAGILWGAVEAEEARSPLGWWAGERQVFVDALLTDPSAAFVSGLATGRGLTLDEAVSFALKGSAESSGVPITEEAE